MLLIEAAVLPQWQWIRAFPPLLAVLVGNGAGYHRGHPRCPLLPSGRGHMGIWLEGSCAFW